MAGCFFIGHRDTPDTVLPALAAEEERHIMEYGVTDFVVGHYGRFDALAAKAVMDAKKRHPAVTLQSVEKVRRKLGFFVCKR